MSRFYSVPYRWLPMTFFANVKSVCGDLFWDGPRNVIRWAPVIWRDRWYDWSFLATIMEYKISRMAEMTEKYGCHVNSYRDARRMRICALLLKRLREDNYSDNAAKFFGYGTKAWRYEQEHVAKQDNELLFTIMKKHFREWWD